MIKIKNKFVSGFTLLEVLVVVAIIGIMTSVAFVSVQRGKIDKEVSAAAEQVASAIREAQNYALSGKQPSTTETTCGFGFRRINLTRYNIFYNHTTASLSTCADVPKIYDTAIASSNFTGITLPNGVLFNGTTSVQRMYFSIPFGMMFNNDGSSLVSIKRFLVYKDTIYYAICVNPGGFVEVRKGNSCT